MGSNSTNEQHLLDHSQNIICESTSFDYNHNGLMSNPFNAERDGIPKGWPTLEKTALHGLAGDLIGIIQPHSEADISGLLLQVLTAFGNMIGRKPHFCAEADCHSLNLFTVLVGETSKGRKGTSWGYVRKIFSEVDAHWAKEKIKSGLSSGEGVIHKVRDPIYKHGMMSLDRTQIDSGSQEIIDPGVEDKRLLVYESEFASAIGVLKRVGNTLSPLLRQAWDTGDLMTLTKNNPTQATEAHISLVGHITKDEIVKNMTDTEALNGFANRILWVCVRRSNILPEGGAFDRVNLSPWIEQLRQVIEFSRGVGEIKRDEEAKEIWSIVYPSLSEGKPGLLGGITNRAEAQVMRIACLYALLERSTTILGPHLCAALSLWKYCEDSAQYIFGQRMHDPIAEKIWLQLREQPDGMTRSQIRDLFSRNKKTKGIQGSLSNLLKQGKVRMEMRTTNGRSEERWLHL
ncbi:DUF3987 domain-containing protein [Candidatus Nitrospira salsa]